MIKRFKILLKGLELRYDDIIIKDINVIKVRNGNGRSN